MKNIIKIISVGLILAVVMVGCAQPQAPYKFNPNNKGIVFVDGKPYRVPYGSQYIKVNNTFVKKLGYKIGCKRNSVWWIEENLFKEFQQLRGVDFATLIVQAARNGKTGCVAPLSDKEYQYYLNQQNQAMANARTAAYYNAATAPKRSYNYNYVTGSIFHYGY